MHPNGVKYEKVSHYINTYPIRGPNKWVREKVIPRHLSYLVSGGISGHPCLRGYKYGGLVLEFGG
jgi:hypothetical protein